MTLRNTAPADVSEGFQVVGSQGESGTGALYLVVIDPNS
jgi:hypothetical protein